MNFAAILPHFSFNFATLFPILSRNLSFIIETVSKVVVSCGCANKHFMKGFDNMKKGRKRLAIIMAVMMAFAVMVPLAVAAQNHLMPASLESFDAVEAFEGTLQLADGREARSASEAMSNGMLRMADEAPTSVEELTAGMPDVVTFEFEGMMLTVDFTNIETVKLDSRDNTSSFAEAIASGQQFTFVDQVDAAELTASENIEELGGTLFCRLFGCQVQWVWVMFPGWPPILGLQCVNCGWIYI
jgi:hypothetical protein